MVSAVHTVEGHMKSKAAAKKRTAQDGHPVAEYFEMKVGKRAKEAYEKKRAGELRRLGPRQRLVQLVYDFVKKERHQMTGNGIGIPDRRIVEILERFAKEVCRGTGLEQVEKE